MFELRSSGGASMYPTIAYSGDFLLSIRQPLLSLLYGSDYIKRGDIIDFHNPRELTSTACKRVIGLEGDTVCVNPLADTIQWVTVPKNHMWVAGDNLGNSVDSRYYGPIPIGMFRGKIIAKVPFWRPWRATTLENQSP